MQSQPVLRPKKVKPMLTLASIAEEIDHLKPVGDVAGRVMALLDDPDCGMSDLSEIIRHEPALTANVLKLANSAYFGLPGKIEDARQAIIYLGMTLVVDLVLLVSCSDSFAGAHEGYALDAGALWKSAVSAAILANDLAELKGVQSRSRVFTGALLRDIGKVVLNQHVQAGIDAITACVEQQGVTFREAEMEVLGFDHAQVGAMVAEKWHFPPVLACIIRHSHDPATADACFAEASLVYVADVMCRKMAIGVGLDDPHYPIDEHLVRSVGISETQMEAVAAAFDSKMERINALFEMA